MGYGEQVGYSNLIESMLGHVLDKGARFTDWSRRPLDKRQIDYAIADVTHLATIFPKMVDKLRKTDRGGWLDEEMERLADPSSFAYPPEDAWKRLKVPGRNPQLLGRLKAIAAWRETEARGKNLPRGRIIKDDTLGELAAHPPKTQDDLGKIRGLSAGWRTNDIGGRLMQALANAKPMSPDELPQRDLKRPGLTKDGALVSDLLKLLLKIRSRDTGVAPKLIARSDELEALAAGVRDGLNILKGWRFDQFGSDALDLVEGRLAFGIVDGKLVMTKTAKIPAAMPRKASRSMRNLSLLLLTPLAAACTSMAPPDATPRQRLFARSACPLHRPSRQRCDRRADEARDRQDRAPLGQARHGGDDGLSRGPADGLRRCREQGRTRQLQLGDLDTRRRARSICPTASTVARPLPRPVRHGAWGCAARSAPSPARCWSAGASPRFPPTAAAPGGSPAPTPSSALPRARRARR